MFVYDDIQWGANRATIGFNSGDGLRFFNLPEASDVFSLANSTNVGIPGTFIFRVDQNQTLSNIGKCMPACLYSSQNLITTSLICFPDPEVVLTVLTAETNVTEPDVGQNTTVTGCFSANLTQPLMMNHSFEFVLSANSTARFGVDFLPNISSVLTIPANFSRSLFSACVDITIFGDNIPEINPEVVVYTIRPLALQDSVVYPLGANSLVINIFDSDGGIL